LRAPWGIVGLSVSGVRHPAAFAARIVDTWAVVPCFHVLSVKAVRGVVAFVWVFVAVPLYHGAATAAALSPVGFWGLIVPLTGLRLGVFLPLATVVLLVFPRALRFLGVLVPGFVLPAAFVISAGFFWGGEWG